MGHIFYCSSWGASATTWLAKALSLHDDVECYHGSRYFPDDEEKKHLTTEEFSQELQKRAASGLCVGAIHGFHGDVMEQPINDLGGSFAYLVRDPVQKLSSLFTSHIDEAQKPENHANYSVMMAGFIKEYHKQFNDLDSLGVFPGVNMKEDSFVMTEELIFFWNISLAMLYDAKIVDSKSPVYKMEDYTTNPVEFEKVFHYLTGGSLTCSQDYLDKVFNVGRVNVHRKKRDDSLIEISHWNENIRLIFFLHIRQHPKMMAYYNSIGYPAMQQFFNFIDQKNSPAT
jgi:hypothetical protein